MAPGASPSPGRSRAESLGARIDARRSVGLETDHEHDRATADRAVLQVLLSIAFAGVYGDDDLFSAGRTGVAGFHGAGSRRAQSLC